MATENEREEGHRMCPVFCTVEVPAALLNLLLENAEEGTHYLIMDIEAGENIQGLKYPSQPPANPSRTSFFNWSIDEVYTYWKKNVCAPGDGSSTTLSAFTFAVVDEQSVREFAEGKGKATTLVLGSDAPDLEEKEDEVVLKSLRLDIEDMSIELMCLEMLTRCPSEIGKAFGLSIQPPPIFAGPPDAARRYKANAIAGIPKTG